MSVSTSVTSKHDKLQDFVPSDDTGQYPPYHTTLHYTLLIILSAYIPLIMVSSTLVISAVVLLKKLHNPHNIIILVISVGDMLAAFVLIPIYVLRGIPVTREMIYSHEYLCRVIVCTVPDCLELIALSNLTFLGFDTLIQVTFPMKYKRFFTNKNTIAGVITIYLVNVSFNATVLGLMNTNCRDSTHLYLSTLAGKVELAYNMGAIGLLLTLCFFFGIYVRCKIDWNQKKTTTERVTVWLLMAFILFYTPTLLMLIFLPNLDYASNELWVYMARLIRLLSPLTNGFLIYLTRPVYKCAFKYFLKTNPIHWNRVHNSIELDKYRKRKTLVPILHTIARASLRADLIVRSALFNYGSHEKTNNKLCIDRIHELTEMINQDQNSQCSKPLSQQETPRQSSHDSKTKQNR